MASSSRINPAHVVDDFVRAMDAVAKYVTVLDDVYQFKNADFAAALKAYTGNLENDPDILSQGVQRHYNLLAEVKAIIERMEAEHLHENATLPQAAKDLLKTRGDRVLKRTERLGAEGLKGWERAAMGGLSLLSVGASFTIPIVGHDKSLLVQRTATNVRNATLLFDFVMSKLSTPDRWLDMFVQRILVPAPGLILYSTTLINEMFYKDPRFNKINLGLSVLSVAVAIGKNAYPMVMQSREIKNVLTVLNSADGEQAEVYAAATNALASDLEDLKAVKAKVQVLQRKFRLSAAGQDAGNTTIGEINAFITAIETMINRVRVSTPNLNLVKKFGVVVAGGLVAVTAIVASIHNPATLAQTIVWGGYYIWRLALSALNPTHDVADTLHIFCQAGAIVMFLLPTLYRDLLQHGPEAMDDYTRRTMALGLTVGVNGTVIHYFGPRGVPVIKAFIGLIRRIGNSCTSHRGEVEDASISMARLDLGHAPLLAPWEGATEYEAPEDEDRNFWDNDEWSEVSVEYEQQILETERLQHLVEKSILEAMEKEQDGLVQPADPFDALLALMDDYEERARGQAPMMGGSLSAATGGSHPALAELSSLGRKDTAGKEEGGGSSIVDFASALGTFKDVRFLSDVANKGNAGGRYDAIQSMVTSLLTDEALTKMANMFGVV